MFQLIQRGQIYADQHGGPSSSTAAHHRQSATGDRAGLTPLQSTDSTMTLSTLITLRRRRFAPNWRRASTLNACALCVRHEERICQTKANFMITTWLKAMK